MQHGWHRCNHCGAACETAYGACNACGDVETPNPTIQGDLFRPMCGRSVAVQSDLFAAEPAPASDGPRIPDLPGQTYLA